MPCVISYVTWIYLDYPRPILNGCLVIGPAKCNWKPVLERVEIYPWKGFPTHPYSICSVIARILWDIPGRNYHVKRIIYINHNTSRYALVPKRFEWNFEWVNLKQILLINGGGISCKIALRWMSLDLTDNKSSLVQVMAGCHQPTSHFLNHCWPRS